VKPSRFIYKAAIASVVDLNSLTRKTTPPFWRVPQHSITRPKIDVQAMTPDFSETHRLKHRNSKCFNLKVAMYRETTAVPMNSKQQTSPSSITSIFRPGSKAKWYNLAGPSESD
jgi:hypothetical protein